MGRSTARSRLLQQDDEAEQETLENNGGAHAAHLGACREKDGGLGGCGGLGEDQGGLSLIRLATERPRR